MEKRRTRFKKGSGFMPLRYLFLVLFLLGLYVLIEDGYDFFVRMGWNVGMIIFLRKGSCIFLIVFFLFIIYLLMRVYRWILKDWRDGSSFSSLPKFIEKGVISFFLVGPCIFSFAMIIGVIYVLVTADESFWHGPFELLDRG